MNLYQKGYGTEKLQLILEEIFKNHKVDRFDRDEIKSFKALEARLDDFHSGKIDILVGTQMLSKGHNFKNVNLVLILGTDSQLNFPDFRSNERVYQLLMQVSGRSGRFGKESKVLIHTLGMENPLFKFVQNPDLNSFYQEELNLRNLCACPPYKRLIMIYFSSRFQSKVIEAVKGAEEILRSIKSKNFQQTEIIGPRPAVVEKKVNKFTWSIMIRDSSVNNLHNLLNSLKNNIHPHYSVSIKVDVDPYHIH